MLQPEFVLRGHVDAVHAADFIGKTYLASASADGSVKVWDLSLRRAVQTFQGSAASINSLQALGADRIAVSGKDGLVNVWSLDASFAIGEAPSAVLRSGCQHFCNIDCMREEGAAANILASSGESSTALLWDIRAPDSPTATFASGNDSSDKPAGFLTSLLLHDHSSQHLLSCGYEDGCIVTFDVRNPSAPLLSSLPKHEEPIFALTKISRTESLISGGGDAYIELTPLGEWRDQATPSSSLRVQLPLAGTSSLSARGDGRLWACGLWDHTIRVFQTKASKPLAVIRHHREGVQAVRFRRPADDENDQSAAAMVSCSKDHTIAMWKLFPETLRSLKPSSSDG